VAHNSIGASGGTVTAAVGTASVTATVEPGTFTAPTDVVVLEGSASSSPSLDGHQTAVVLAISLERDGQKLTGTFSSPVKVTITDSSIQAVDDLLVYDPASGSYVPAASSTTVSDVSVAAGSVSFDILADPAVAIAAPLTASGATTSQSPSAVAGSPAGSTTSAAVSSTAGGSGTSPGSAGSDTSGTSSGGGSSPAAVSVGGSSSAPPASSPVGQQLAYTGLPLTFYIWMVCAGLCFVATGIVGRRLVRSRVQ
jgi:hypothetical protein